MFEPDVFQKQMHCIEESTCVATLLGLFGARGNVPLLPLVGRKASLRP